jgi:two-component system response regulator
MARTVVEAAVVLLVEDDPGDVMLTTDSFEECHLGLRLHIVRDGEEAMRFLRHTGEFTATPRPTLILLDLNLPRRGGLEILADLKADPDLHSIPVVVLTTSQAEDDISRCYDLHANAYVIKPMDAAQFSDTIKQIDEFFLILMRRPQI